MRYAFPYSPSKAKILLLNGADPNSIAADGITPLVNLLQGINNNLRGIKQNKMGEEENLRISLKKLEILLSHGANPNMPVKEGKEIVYPLMNILYTPKSIAAATILFKFGANPNLGKIHDDGCQTTPLMKAALEPDLTMIYTPFLVHGESN